MSSACKYELTIVGSESAVSDNGQYALWYTCFISVDFVKSLDCLNKEACRA